MRGKCDPNCLNELQEAIGEVRQLAIKRDPDWSAVKRLLDTAEVVLSGFEGYGDILDDDEEEGSEHRIVHDRRYREGEPWCVKCDAPTDGTVCPFDETKGKETP